jgi:hypothetical protein
VLACSNEADSTAQLAGELAGEPKAALTAGLYRVTGLQAFMRRPSARPEQFRFTCDKTATGEAEML